MAEHIGKLLTRVRRESDSSVLGLVGPWGSGKSSILRMLEEHLAERHEWIVAHFTPWAYSDAESLQRGFFAELRAALPKGRQWKQTRQTIGKVAAAVAPLASIGEYAGLSGEAPANLLRDLITGDTSVSATHQRAQQALKDQDQPILVILDDLDRLEAPELLLVLKLVRMIGRLTNVYYLLSYDEQTLIDLLMHTSLVGKSPERAQNYLEKLVQVRLDLPSLRPYQRSALVHRAINHISSRRSLIWSEDQEARYKKLMDDYLLERLDSPRTINRVFGQTDAFYELVHDEVDFVDYLAVTWLRTEEPGVHRMVQRYRAEVLGESDEQLQRSFSPRQKDLSGLATRWRTRVQDGATQDRHVDTVLGLLAHLFPVVRAEMRSQGHPSYDLDLVGARRGVGHPDYFDNYFSYGVPTEGLADKVVMDAINALAAGASSPAVDRIAIELRQHTGRVAWKLKRRLGQSDRAILPLLRLVAEQYPRLDDGRGTLSFGQTAEANSLSYHLLLQLPPADVVAFVGDCCRTPSGLDHMSEVVRFAPKNPAEEAGNGLRRETRPPWADEATRVVTDALREHHAHLRDMPLSTFSLNHLPRWWTWWQLDTQNASQWLRAQVDDGRWDLLAVLKHWVSGARIMGVSNAQLRLSELSDAVVEAIGVERVLRDLGSWLALAPAAPAGGLDHPEDTEANRELVVAHSLRQWATRLQPRSPGPES
ncbi:KAP-like P-loop domain-containing protein [Kineococcus rhizosphaerae]|uniref:KAP-like P-loop domain-containing protein n=2 Tax=Kineococcus rhizosphaerae TaxID=559628 RepID=A0A2T0QN98_9ACTN|nr:KAP-like P-loop domain-containing protein [Kineococcus rhizosphaerae]